MYRVMLVNNTDAVLTPWYATLMEAIKAGELPPELADIFTLKILVDNGVKKGILNWA